LCLPLRSPGGRITVRGGSPLLGSRWQSFAVHRAIMCSRLPQFSKFCEGRAAVEWQVTSSVAQGEEWEGERAWRRCMCEYAYMHVTVFAHCS
jgi:hypothetical protein